MAIPNIRNNNQYDPANGQPQPMNPGQQNHGIQVGFGTEEENQALRNAVNVAFNFLGLDEAGEQEEIGYRFDNELTDSEDEELDQIYVNPQEQNPSRNFMVDEQQQSGALAGYTRQVLG